MEAMTTLHQAYQPVQTQTVMITMVMTNTSQAIIRTQKRVTITCDSGSEKGLEDEMMNSSGISNSSVGTNNNSASDTDQVSDEA